LIPRRRPSSPSLLLVFFFFLYPPLTCSEAVQAFLPSFPVLQPTSFFCMVETSSSTSPLNLFHPNRLFFPAAPLRVFYVKSCFLRGSVEMGPFLFLFSQYFSFSYLFYFFFLPRTGKFLLPTHRLLDLKPFPSQAVFRPSSGGLWVKRLCLLYAHCRRRPFMEPRLPSL